MASNAIAQGIRVLLESVAPSTFSILGLLAVIAGLAMLVGLLTPIVGSTLALGYLIDTVSLFLSNGSDKTASAFLTLFLSIISLALALLGPGAFSVDARLFDRVEIIIPKRRRPPF